MSPQYLITFSPIFIPDQHKSTYFYVSVVFTLNRIFFVTGSLKELSYMQQGTDN